MPRICGEGAFSASFCCLIYHQSTILELPGMTMETYPYSTLSWNLLQPHDFEKECHVTPANVMHQPPDEQSSLNGIFSSTPGQLDSCILAYFNCHDGVVTEQANVAQQYPTPWDPACLETDNEAMMISEYQHSLTLFQYLETNEGDPDKSLFTTPPPWPFPFCNVQGSPISDPCSTPDTSHACSIPSDHDWDSEDIRALRSPISPIAELAPFGLPSETVDDEDSLTLLEMPDGSFRMSLNWLPVDTTAGFTIGSRKPAHQLDKNDELDMEVLPDVPEDFMRPVK